MISYIAWSNRAREMNERGNQGYIHQAMDVALNPKGFYTVDLDKAKRICLNAGLEGFAQRCALEIAERERKTNA